jgi:hypothetical protein
MSEDPARAPKERSSFDGWVAAASARRPVFLHGLWRSGSTYLWSRFRTSPHARCFYEPLHHGLAKLTPERIARDTPEQIGANGHPALRAPYFQEFAPLIDQRGVRGYREDLAYHRFALRPAEAHPRLEAYIAGLLDAAEADGRAAVLGFNRTGLRIAWLKARFPAARHIHIDRDPAAIWASYAAEAGKGNYAFFGMWLRVLLANGEHPLYAPLLERLGLHRRPRALGLSKAGVRQIVDAMGEAQSYFMVYYLWLACAEHARAECEILIDTRLADRAAYRRRVEREIAAAVGFRVDLSDMRAAPPRATPPAVFRARIEQSAEALLPFGAIPKTPPFQRPRLSPWSGEGRSAVSAR